MKVLVIFFCLLVLASLNQEAGASVIGSHHALQIDFQKMLMLRDLHAVCQRTRYSNLCYSLSIIKANGSNYEKQVARRILIKLLKKLRS